MPNNENDNREVSTNSVHSGHKHSSFCSVNRRSNISAADDISQQIIISNKKEKQHYLLSGELRSKAGLQEKGQSTGQESDGQGEVNKMKGGGWGFYWGGMKVEEGNRRVR